MSNPWIYLIWVMNPLFRADNIIELEGLNSAVEVLHHFKTIRGRDMVLNIPLKPCVRLPRTLLFRQFRHRQYIPALVTASIHASQNRGPK